ncbi:hypothetical protein QEN19_000704 [Hanseniaspora menglaensis]
MTSETKIRKTLLKWSFKSHNFSKRKFKVIFRLLLSVSLLLLLCVYFKIVDFSKTEEPLSSELPYFSKKDSPFYSGCNNIQEYLSQPEYQKQNATFIMLTRNKEVNDVVKTLENIEIRFNQWFQYPYVFLNDEAFDETFRSKVLKTVSVPKNMVKFETLDVKKEWTFQDENSSKTSEKIDIFLKDQEDRGLLYGGMKSYHKMCRFYSGFFQDHKALENFDYYWRIEPDVNFFCDLTYDPFYEMNKSGKKYGFTVFISELYWTIPSLFRYTKTFINNYAKQNSSFKLGTLWNLFIKDFKVLDIDYSTRDMTDTKLLDKFINSEGDLNREISRFVEMKHFLKNKMAVTNLKENGYKKGYVESVKFAKKLPQIYDDKFFNEEFNLCHFWSNFEIASFDVFRSPIYREYFSFLDKKMGFVKERFGDAAVHTLGVAMMLNLEDIHYFRDIGYSHSSLTHCVKNNPNSGYFENKVDEAFLNEKWSNYKHHPYSRKDKYQNKIRESFKKILSKADLANEHVNVGCNCNCPVWYNEVENASNICSAKLFEVMHDDYVPKKVINPEKVINKIADEYQSLLKDV